MKLSIITINLNNCNGLQRTIESIISQSFSDFEFYIIDGGSTDGSIEVIKQFNERITYWISEPDKGIYHAMNKGIKQSSGEYCLFLNSGDFLVDSDVLRQVFNNDLNEDIVLGDCNVSRNKTVVFKAIPPDPITLSAFWGRSIAHQSAFIRRDLFERLGYYSEEYWLHSDLDFFLRSIIINNCKVKHLTVTVSDYNLEGFSSDNNNSSVSKEECEAIFTKLIPARILLDYQNWTNKEKEMEILYWFKSKRVLFFMLKMIYDSAVFLANFIKKFRKADTYMTNKC